MPVKDGTYYVITRGGHGAGGVPHSLSGAYLQDYASYGYETSWVDRSHQSGVQCTGTITLACLKCNSSPDKHVFLYLFPDCLCIIIHFSAHPTTITARVLCLFAQVCKRKNPFSEPRLASIRL